MAKRKAAPETPPEPPDTTKEGAVIIHMKGSQEYAAWLEALHQKTHIAKVVLFRLAMAEYARTHGHESPPIR